MRIPILLATLLLVGCGGTSQVHLPPTVVVCAAEQEPKDAAGAPIKCPSPEELREGKARIGDVYIAYEACRVRWLADREANRACARAHQSKE